MQLKNSGLNWQIETAIYSIIDFTYLGKNYFLRCFPHPPYTPDLTSSDDFYFRYLQNSLNLKKNNIDVGAKLCLSQFFANKNQKFNERGIMRLLER